MTSRVSSKNKEKIVLKKRDQTEKKKETVQRNRKQRRRESNPVYTMRQDNSEEVFAAKRARKSLAR